MRLRRNDPTNILLKNVMLTPIAEGRVLPGSRRQLLSLQVLPCESLCSLPYVSRLEPEYFQISQTHLVTAVAPRGSSAERVLLSDS
jgi:hypothetical protein